MEYTAKSNNFSTKFLQSNTLLICVIVLLVLKVTTVLLSINIPQNIFFADITKIALENFVNQTRQSAGLQPLLTNEKLNQAAELKAQNMVQDQYFNHNSPSGVTPWYWFAKVGYKYKYAGENLAIGFYESEEVFNAWLNSPSHRDNIVNPKYTEVGTAVLKGFGDGNIIVVVQEFGSPLVPKPTVTTTQEVTPKPAPKPAPEPVIKPEPASNGQNLSSNNEERVLSQSTEFLEAPHGVAVNNLSSRLLNSILYDYDNLLRNTIYVVFAIVITAFLLVVFSNINNNFGRQLAFRAVLIVVLVSAAALINKDVVVALIPHQIII